MKNIKSRSLKLWFEKCFRFELRYIFESHWVNEFFKTIVYFKSNTAEEIEINCILLHCSVIVI